MVVGLGADCHRLRSLQPGPRNAGAFPPLREPVEERSSTPDRLQPQVRRVLPRHRLLARRAQPQCPRDRKSSGVVQPPVHATAMLYVYRHAEDEATVRAFLEYNFPKLKAWHEYLHRERDPEGEGLVYIRHPWESGMDNSPMWDSIMERMQ